MTPAKEGRTAGAPVSATSGRYRFFAKRTHRRGLARGGAGSRTADALAVSRCVAKSRLRHTSGRRRRERLGPRTTLPDLEVPHPRSHEDRPVGGMTHVHARLPPWRTGNDHVCPGPAATEQLLREAAARIGRCHQAATDRPPQRNPRPADSVAGPSQGRGHRAGRGSCRRHRRVIFAKRTHRARSRSVGGGGHRAEPVLHFLLRDAILLWRPRGVKDALESASTSRDLERQCMGCATRSRVCHWLVLMLIAGLALSECGPLACPEISDRVDVRSSYVGRDVLH
jgi:hypothetical protein